MSEPAIIAERRNAAWTPGEDAQLLERRKSGDPVSVIAALLKRPVPAVYARAIKLGSKVIERKTWTEAEDARLRSLVLTAGLNNRQIAEAMGIRHSAVCWRIRQLKLTGVRPVPVAPACKPVKARPPRHPRKSGDKEWSAAEDARLTELANAREITVIEAAVKLGRPLSGTRSRASKLKVRFITTAEQSQIGADSALSAAFAVTADPGRPAPAEPDPETLAKTLGRSVRWVLKRSLKLGLRTAARQGDLDAEGIARIRDLALTHTITEVAAVTKRDTRTLKALSASEGFAFRAAVRTAVTVSRPARIRSDLKPAVPKSVVHKSVVRPPADQPRKPMSLTTPAPVEREEMPGDALGPEGLRKRLVLIREVAERMRRQGRLLR